MRYNFVNTTAFALKLRRVRFCWFHKIMRFMATEIKVYLGSTVISSELISLQYSYDHHYYMEDHHRGNYHWLRDQGFSKGRIFEPDSAAMLPILEKAMIIFESGVRIYDLNTIRGKLHGWSVGIRRTPSVLIGKEKYLGLSAARVALMNLLDSQTGEIEL